jgi:hypothetical protein
MSPIQPGYFHELVAMKTPPSARVRSLGARSDGIPGYGSAGGAVSHITVTVPSLSLSGVQPLLRRVDGNPQFVQLVSNGILVLEIVQVDKQALNGLIVLLRFGKDLVGGIEFAELHFRIRQIDERLAQRQIYLQELQARLFASGYQRFQLFLMVHKRTGQTTTQPRIVAGATSVRPRRSLRLVGAGSLQALRRWAYIEHRNVLAVNAGPKFPKSAG